MSLTGSLFLALVIVITVVAFALVVAAWPRVAGPQVGRVLARIGMLLGVNVMVLLTAATQLNAQYLFFADWTDLRGAFGGTPTSTSLTRGGDARKAAGQTVAGTAAVAAPVLPPLPSGGVSSTGVITYTITGQLSGLTGKVVVQLPDGYTAAANASTRYPVLQTFSGYPSAPTQWIGTMHLGGAISTAAAANQMRPTLIVSPQLQFPAGADTECVNGQTGNPQVETWLTQDVPNWVARTFRVQTERSSWATIGLSAGGWCAAMATMLHPAQYSAAIVMGGYFAPVFGPQPTPYPAGSPLAARYDLVALTKKSPPPVAVWVQTSHSDPLSYGSSAAFLKAARPPLAARGVVLQHAGHRLSLWQGLLPTSLRWLGANVSGFGPIA